MKKLGKLAGQHGIFGIVTFCIVLVAATSNGQQINGVPGSPSATMTLDGKQLPPPPMPFGGVIKERGQGFHAVVAAARRAAQGRTQHPADHDR